MRDFLNRMVRAKAGLNRNRDGNGGGGKVYGRRSSRRPDPETGTREYVEAAAYADLTNVKSEAIEALRFTLYGHETEGM